MSGKCELDITLDGQIIILNTVLRRVDVDRSYRAQWSPNGGRGQGKKKVKTDSEIL